jgi:phenylpropionate dioxygenase-like ring-hydroxylating dioxygenase large terminal subunit
MTPPDPQTQRLLRELEAAVATPLERASALSPGIYLSQDIHALEQERIFAREWVSPGLAAEIPEPGDYLTFAVAGQPVVCVRGKDREVRTFANVCRHRMMQLLDGRGRAGRIVCPYHAWTYDLAGKLIRAPEMDRSEGFDAGDICLPEIRTEIWQGWIYVTLDDGAEPVAARLADLEPVVGRYRMAGYVPVLHQDHVWDTNWKLLTENFMESYHLPMAHRKTVGAWFTPDDNRFPAQVFDSFTYQTFTKDETAKYGRAHADNTVLEDEWRYTSVMPTVYPTHMYVLAPDHLWWLTLRPRGVGQVHVRFGAALAPEVMAGLDDAEAFLKETEAFFDEVNDEDRFVVEGIFKGASAPLTRPGRLSWMERSIHDFQAWLARRLTGPAGAAALRGEAAE